MVHYSGCVEGLFRSVCVRVRVCERGVRESIKRG